MKVLQKEETNIMTSFKFRPYLSLIGFCNFIITVLVNIAFRLATEPGSKMLLSTFSAILWVFTLLWGLMGVKELILLNKATNRMKKAYINKRIRGEEYRRGINHLKLCYLINVTYLVIVLFQIWYVITNWDRLNV
ncbi:hypothetical protein LJK88_46825 [Paenibacillus sp. P26]|nr:hypothetical protein LJK88_46825 [Paenibacillus sp. P26]UUZ91910.1 hypothetical protein LJK87_41520 [Paenibacillus sp. P25]